MKPPADDILAPGAGESRADVRRTAEQPEYADALSQLRRVYSFLNMTNEAIARIRQPEPLFDEACRIAVEVGGFRMAWIGLADPESGQIRPVAHHGFEEGYLEKIFVSADGTSRQGLGPTGTAVRTGVVNICRDFATDPRMAPWRDEAMKRGYRSSGGFPLRIGDRVIGALTLYASETDFFDDELVDLFKTLADDISLAVDAMEKDRLRMIAEDELALRAQLLDAASDSILVYDEQGDLVYANEASWLTRGYSRVEFMSLNLRELTTPEYALLIQERLFLAERSGSAIFESEHLRKDGSVMPVEVHIRPINAGGRNLFLSAVRDTTERKKAERELSDYRDHLEELVDERTRPLQFLNEELESFGYSVSHDLRSPLRAIDGFAHMLLEDLGEGLDEDGRSSFEYIFKGVRRMDDIIDGLLRLSRSGSAELEVEQVDMSRLIAEVIGEAGTDMGERQVEFVVGDLPDAFCDKALVRQAFANLLSNALKFTRDSVPSIIEVEAEARGEEIVYSVRDNGTGFDPDQADRLFGLFQRLHSRELYEGTGVGLALVQRIARRHEGRVWAEGKPGEGATFCFAIPRTPRGISKA